ncbi:MAG: type II toxin-antitoxin system Phd/YefM family antitoxin [Cyanobacteria bacterium SZAS TMP-1]|nr:type II toxin-antitoxin system Phd/YefM family antitoxin [Cyanobacteria bacterium SZAS TMP-1]
MKTIQATEIKKRFDEVMDIAQAEPVMIQKSVRKSVVMISATEYERLTALDDAYWAARADKAEASGLVSAQELNKLIKDAQGA